MAPPGVKRFLSGFALIIFLSIYSHTNWLTGLFGPPRRSVVAASLVGGRTPSHFELFGSQHFWMNTI